MVDDDGFEPAAILAELEKEKEGGGFKPLPSALPLADITALPALFQCRPLNEQHIEEMAKAVEGGAVLPALLVVQVGGRAVLLDGHHRLEALKLAGAKVVSVEVFAGTLREAVLVACAANSKTKLPMTKTERTDTAWKFVLIGAFSRSRICKAASVAEGTVANMRRVKTKLGEEAFGVQSWAKAMLLASNSNPASMGEEGLAAWIEVAAQRHADTMAKTFGGKLSANPEVAARALSIYFGRRLAAVVLELQDYLPEPSEEDY